jgi:hypothetical protein
MAKEASLFAHAIYMQIASPDAVQLAGGIPASAPTATEGIYVHMMADLMRLSYCRGDDVERVVARARDLFELEKVCDPWFRRTARPPRERDRSPSSCSTWSTTPLVAAQQGA